MTTLSPLPATTDVGYGITCIDTEQERAGMACCYLIEQDGEAALVDCGTSPGADRLLAVLRSRGIAPEHVRYLMPTHVHLDHAGAAGVLMRQLPNAQLIAHPRAARHLIDPSKLIEGAIAVYGADAVRLAYGQILPVDAARVVIADDGHRLTLGAARELLLLDTPGHARHHYSVWDAQSRGFFTGDTFGISYREFDGPQGPWLMPTTTPVQFEPEAWEQTLDRYLSFAPQRMYLTHYGCVEDIARLAHDLRAGLCDYQHLAMSIEARGAARHAGIRDAIENWSLAALRRHGAPVDEQQARRLLAADMELNAQGLGVWLDRQAAA